MGAKRLHQRDPNGQHARLYHDILKTPAWIALSSSAIRLFVDLRLKLTSYNNGNIEAVFSELKHRGWQSKTTMHKALRELETLGFIVQTRLGGIASMSRICSLYRFTDQEAIDSPKLHITGCKATYDYRQFESVRGAKATVAEAERQHRERGAARRKKVKVPNLDVSGAETGLMKGQDKSRNGTPSPPTSPETALIRKANIPA